MNLGNLWVWEKRKLGCRTDVTAQNPALTEIQERLSKMTGIEIPKTSKQTSGVGVKATDAHRPVTSINLSAVSDEKHNPMSTSLASLAAFQQDACSKSISKTRMNIYKRFSQVPRSPPAKVMLDLQKDRLQLPVARGSHQLEKDERHNGMQVSSPHRLQGASLAKAELTSFHPRLSHSKSHGDDKYGDLEVLGPKGRDPSLHRTHMNNIVYQSRLSDHTGSKINRHELLKKEAALSKQTPLVKDLVQEQNNKNPKVTQPIKTPGLYEVRLHCANSLATWSTCRENAMRLVEEGAVTAAIVLSKDDNEEVRRVAATTFKNMSHHVALCEQLVERAAVPAVSDLGANSKEVSVARDCGVALVNLTCMDGIEAKIVEDGIVIALMSIMNKHAELAELCTRGLFNLTCVDQPYMYIERVVKAFVSLASQTLPVVKHLCAAAFCNLSDIKPLRPRIVEEGVVQVVGVLARGAESKTRRVCAIVVRSLASTRACRVDMVCKGAVQVLYALSSDVDTVTLHYIASAIIRLITEEQNLPRLIHEGGVTALCNICLRCPRDTVTTQLCASALRMMSRQAVGRQAIVQEGCVPALVTLLHEASDSSTLLHGVSALTRVLADEANHEQVLGQGGVSAIINLCTHTCTRIRGSCALALFNFSCGKAASERSISASAIPAIINLTRLPEPLTRMLCAASLCKLASVEPNVSLMVDEGVVPAFIDMMQTRHQDIVKHCCAALCRLAHEGSCAVTITTGAVPHVIAGCGKGSDSATHKSCCAVLSAISAHEPCRQPLCDLGALQALVTVAGDRTADDTTRLRCAVAFANLSHESAVQGPMIEAGIIPLIAELSNSYCEKNQLYCARALCNLGCRIGYEEKIVQQGGVTSLMMICMVRSVSHLTKQVCARAFLNLLNAPTVTENRLPQLAEEGLIQAMSSLSRLPEEETMSVCASIFCNLSAQGPVGRGLLVERRTSLEFFFNLMRAKDKATQTTCGKAACNLIGHTESRQPAIRAGAISVLRSLIALDDPVAKVAAAESFLRIAEDRASRQEMVNSNVVVDLIKGANSPHFPTQKTCVCVLVQLAWCSSVRVPLLNANIVNELVGLVKAGLSAGLQAEKDIVYKAILHIFTYMSFMSEEHRALMVYDNILQALEVLYQKLCLSDSAVDPSNAKVLVAVAIRSLTSAGDVLDKLINDGAVQLLFNIICANNEMPNDNELHAHCARALYSIVQQRRFNKILLDHNILKTIPILGNIPSCYALTAAVLHILALEPTHRELIATSLPVQHVVQLAQASDDPNPSSTAQSCARIFCLLSTCTTEAREILASAGLVPFFMRMSGHEDEKVAISYSEALKHLTSGNSSGIEEGSVSALISSIYTGVDDSKTIAPETDSLTELPTCLLVEDTYKPSDELLPTYLLGTFEAHTVPTAKIPGGIAGAGPPPPQPPEMNVQEALNLTFEETMDIMEDDENTSASMIFAKMASTTNVAA